MAGSAWAQSEAERIRALENLIQQQQQQIEAQQEALEKMQAELKTIRETGSTGQPGRNRVVLSRDNPVSLTIEGQVNRAMLYYNDGNTQDVRHVDNDASSTRLAFKGSVQATSDLKIGTNIEVQFESNSTADVNQADNTAGGTNNFTERKLELYASSKRFGTLTLGQGSTASDGMTEVDLSGTDLVGYSAVADSASALSFATATTGAIAGNPTVGGVFSNLDGLSRDDRVRYDTPSIAGIVLSTSFVDGGEYDVAASYSASYGTFEVDSKIGLANQSATRTFPESIFGGSISILHESGINVTGAAAQGDDSESARDAQNFWYAKLGYITAAVFPLGESRFSADYGQYNDVAANQDEATTYGLQFVQSISQWGTELYAGYRRYDLERPGSNLDEIDILLAGARVKF